MLNRKSWAPLWMPRVWMIEKSHEFVAGANRGKFKPGTRNVVIEIRISRQGD